MTAPDPRSGRQVTAGRIIAPSARIDSVAFVDLAETRLIVAQHPSQADVS